MKSSSDLKNAVVSHHLQRCFSKSGPIAQEVKVIFLIDQEVICPLTFPDPPPPLGNLGAADVMTSSLWWHTECVLGGFSALTLRTSILTVLTDTAGGVAATQQVEGLSSCFQECQTC